MSEVITVKKKQANKKNTIYFYKMLRVHVISEYKIGNVSFFYGLFSPFQQNNRKSSLSFKLFIYTQIPMPLY
uniref:Uncharacterized protein n=1 Tax=Anguilla anguilla TaxID=7936 RepID=A0A0E9WUC3_ANGAN